MKKRMIAFLMLAISLFALARCAMTATTASLSPDTTATNVGTAPSVPASDSAVINMPGSAADTTHGIGLAGVSNARDIGGYKTADGKTVKAGMLLRTGALASANDTDKKILNDIYHVKIIVDLRYDSEIAQSPELILPGVANIHAPILKDVSASQSSTSAVPTASTSSAALASAKPDRIDLLIGYVKRIGDVDAMITNQYSSMVTDEYSINGYKQFFDTILSVHDGAIVYHCSGGKDRTGIASMLLLSALGVDRQTAEADYMLTKDFIKSSIDMTTASAAAKGADQATQHGIELLMGVDQKWADTVFDTINTNYGSMDNFLQEKLGLTPDKIDQLKRMYLQ